MPPCHYHTYHFLSCAHVTHPPRVDAEFSAKAKIQMLTDGTTAVVAVIHDGKIFVGNGIYVPVAAMCIQSITQ